MLANTSILPVPLRIAVTGSWRSVPPRSCQASVQTPPGVVCQIVLSPPPPFLTKISSRPS
ncbi:hypothetical protein VM95_03835 [Streptomyces rubellomurinus]|uniref:Uncharacterized protein n=1 Tax=Streptomyces rubellomurinus (strain ATCC 31215) TaxID=359131 RepID=A0A0F2TJK2_STRR3|nr:hypothetical protein VM95_03835 [Streptomyces rubellomurinus]